MYISTHAYICICICLCLCVCMYPFVRLSACRRPACLGCLCVRMSVIFREDTHTHTHVYAHMLVQGIIWVLDDHRMHIWSVVV